MLKLKSEVGRVEIKAMGITLTPKSSQKDFKQALKHQPKLKAYIIESNEKDNDSKEKKIENKS